MTDIVMPRLSDSMEEGTVLTWMKKVGDEIAVGDEIVEIETDKANMAYESDVAGTLTEILAEEGATLPIGSPIARVGDSDEGQDGQPAGPVAAGGPPPPPVARRLPRGWAPLRRHPREDRLPRPKLQTAEAGATSGEAEASKDAKTGERIKASPVARRIAKEKASTWPPSRAPGQVAGSSRRT